MTMPSKQGRTGRMPGLSLAILLLLLPAFGADAQSTAQAARSEPAPGRGYLGLELGPGPNAKTSTIMALVPGSPAATGGLKVGDLITSIGSRQSKTDAVGMGSVAAMVAFISTRSPGDQVVLSYSRNGAPTVAALTVAARPGLVPVAGNELPAPEGGSAPRLLPLGVPVAGRFDPTDRKHGSIGQKFDCFQIQARPGQHLRLTTFTGFFAQTHVKRGKCDYYADTVAWSMPAAGQDGFAFRFTVPPRGALAVWIAGNPEHSPDYVLQLDELTPTELAAWQAETQQKQIAAQQAKDRRAEDRAALLGQVVQGAMIAGQAYAAGMQEANEANARSQAIIDAAAESDRQYRAAQRASELAQRIASEPAPVRPVQQVQASARRTAPPVPKPAPSGLSQTTTPAATRGTTAAQGGMQSRSARAYFVTGLVPTANNTRNPLCYSNPVTVTFMSDPKGWGDAGRAAEAAAPYASVFRAKCERLGQVDAGMLGANIEGVTSGWPYPAFHAEDRRVTLP